MNVLPEMKEYSDRLLLLAEEAQSFQIHAPKVLLDFRTTVHLPMLPPFSGARYDASMEGVRMVSAVFPRPFDYGYLPLFEKTNEPPAPEADVIAYEILYDSIAERLRASLWACCELTLGQFDFLVARQGCGTDGLLKTDGRANVAFVQFQGNDSLPVVVSARWQRGGHDARAGWVLSWASIYDVIHKPRKGDLLLARKI